MTAADIYRSHVFCNAYCTSFFEKTIDKSASFDIIDSVPNELNIWGYSSAGRALEWHSRGQRFDPAYLHQTKKRTLAIVSGGAFYLSGRIYLRVPYFAARFLRLLNRAFK